MREGSRTSLPSPPLLFIAFSTPHRSPLSERLEQAKPKISDLVSSRVAVLSPSRFSHSLQEEERSGKEIGPDVPYVVFISSFSHPPRIVVLLQCVT